MDCIQSIQKAIEYMEEHILEPINYEDAARQVYMSNYHFHRLFSLITGITANEYIRNRRLSMAGQELILSDKKVIDIAFKYGYESPESFAKAFSRFHGVSPHAAKRPGVQLQSFNRLILKIILEGGTAMEYRIVEREPFKLLAKVQSFGIEAAASLDGVSEEGNMEVHEFWESAGKNGIIDVLHQHTTCHELYGVCTHVSEESTFFDYGIGVLYDGGEVPEGYRIWEVEPTLWAVFKCIGQEVDCIGTTWERIFKEFLPGADYNMLDDTDFELYLTNRQPDYFCEIWIPVEKK